MNPAPQRTRGASRGATRQIAVSAIRQVAAASMVIITARAFLKEMPAMTFATTGCEGTFSFRGYREAALPRADRKRRPGHECKGCLQTLTGRICHSRRSVLLQANPPSRRQSAEP